MLESLNKTYSVGLYIRLSREDDDKVEMSESITNQKSLFLQYVKENNLRVYDIYILMMDILERTLIDQLLTDCLKI